MKNLWLFPVLFLICTPLSAQTKETLTTGNAFLRTCSIVEKETLTDLESLTMIHCLVHVDGFVNGVETEQRFAEAYMHQEVPLPFCVPESVELGQMIRIVLKYIRDNPAEANKYTAVLITRALGKAYPCPAK